jgi:hypothetical protein
VVTGLLDTAILVDLLRSYEPSRDWLAEQPHLGIVPMVWLEIIQGAENLRSQRRAVELLRHFERVELESVDFDWAIGQALRLKLSHSVDVMDCVIAAASHRLGLPLYTRNLKHFEPMLGALARKPY